MSRNPSTDFAIALLVRTAIVWTVVAGAGCSGDASLEDEAPGEALRRLEALPYVSATPVDPDEAGTVGVTVHDPTRAYQGSNLYHDFKNAHLIDMTGAILHTWEARAESALHHVELAGDGDLLAIVKDRALLRLDRSSHLLWRVGGRFHHDLAEDREGKLYVLGRKSAWIDYEGTRLPLLDDRIFVLSAGGSVLEEISVGTLVAGHIPRARLDEAKRQFETEPGATARPAERDSVFDMLHTNSIELLPQVIPGVGAAGDALVCFRELDEIAALDLEERRVVWSWGKGVLDGPHHAVPLDRGRILVYDNGRQRGFTRLLVLDPSTGTIEWEHQGRPPASLFSDVMGSGQPLPNGNLLVTDSVHGRVLEITRDHDVVWEWYNRLTEPDDGFGDRPQRLTIYRMQRLPR